MLLVLYIYVYEYCTVLYCVQIQSSVLLMSGYATGKKVYKVSKMTDIPDHLTSAPCGVCPVRNQVLFR